MKKKLRIVAPALVVGLLFSATACASAAGADEAEPTSDAGNTELIVGALAALTEVGTLTLPTRQGERVHPPVG